MDVVGDLEGDNDVVLSQSEYLALVEAEEFLMALQAAGVDNWDGYDYALEIFQENKE